MENLETEKFDYVIIGAGPAGLSAAVPSPAANAPDYP